MGRHRPYKPRNNALGQTLLTLRYQTKLTQIELATLVGVSKRSVLNWEGGESYPKEGHLRRLIALFVAKGAFTPGDELAEAEQLWERASQDASQRLGRFDRAWFDQLLAGGSVDGIGDLRPAPGASQRSIATASHPLDTGHRRRDDRNVAIGLPFQPTSFIGRDAELTEIATILGDPGCHLLTLLGPGGIGKTRLALEVAATHTTAFADGVAFVALASVSTPNQIVSTITDTLGLSFAGHSDATADLLGYLRERQMLLVLDNFEHLLAGADLLSAILERAPHITVLVTSQERLDLQAERLFDVDGLACPSEDPHGLATPHSLADLADYSAVQLFVQRATQVQPRLSLSESALTTIVRICQHVAGMPLAIELAAAGVRALPLAEIERQLRANLDMLATSLRDVPARHRSMRAVFDHSWSLLSESQRALFSHLAVFRGGWTIEAAEAVCAQGKRQQAKGKNEDSDAPVLPFTFSLLPLLTALVDKSLVRREGSPETRPIFERDAPNAEGKSRFVMLEPIRAYALEQLAASSDAEAVRRGHAHYFATLAEAAVAQWDTPMINQALALQRREHDNMRAALQWACDTGDGLVGLRLAQALWGFWRSYGYSSEGRAWLQQLLRLDEHPADPAAMTARQRALHAAAWLASDQHDFTTATRLFEQSMALRRALGETEGETDLLINAARQARATGQYQRATDLLEDALSRHRPLFDRASLSSARPELSLHEHGQVLRELALVLRERGDFARAVALLDEALTLYRQIGDRVSVALALLGLGDIARDQGDSAGIRENCEPSLAILRESGMQWAIGFALNSLALGAYYEGDLVPAFTLIGESVALFRGLNADASLAEVLITLGYILKAQGDVVAARGAMTEALRLAWVVGPRLLVAASLEGLASVAAEQGHADLTARLLATAAALRADMGAPVRPADQAAVDAALESAQSNLSAGAFAAMWAEAQSLPAEQILNDLPSVAMFTAVRDRSET
jgi:predicted ATPase/transcriptional regulator with XRE-family HTH domain